MPMDFIQQVDNFCKEKKYVTKKKLKVLAVTFNVNAKIEQDHHMGTIFPDISKYRADIVIIGFQEIVELSATNVVGSAVLGDIKVHVDTWEKMILEHLNRGITSIRRANDSNHGIMPYISFKINQMVGTAAIMFVLEAFKPCIKNVQVGTVTRGIGNVLGNKGGVCIRFEIESTSICFVISHLSAHRENVTKRNEDYTAIITSKIFEEKCYGFSMTNTTTNTTNSNIPVNNLNCSDDINKSSNLLKLNVTLPSAINNKYLDPRVTAISKELKALQKRMNIITPSSSSTAVATNVVTTAIASTPVPPPSSSSSSSLLGVSNELNESSSALLDATVMSTSNSPFIINPTYSSSSSSSSSSVIPVTNINASTAVSTSSSTVTNILNNNTISSIITTNSSSTQVSTTGTSATAASGSSGASVTPLTNNTTSSNANTTISSSSVTSSTAASVGGTKLQSPISEEITSLSQFSPDDHDIIIWLGDLNYRIVDELNLQDVYQLILNSDSDGDYRKRLFTYDQLYREMNEGNAFDMFSEAEITFNPTYQYIPGKDAYDRREDKKMRVPAWCDRILYRIGKSVEKMKNILLNLKNEGGNTIVSEILKSAYPSDMRYLKADIIQQLLSTSGVCNDDDAKKGMRSTFVGLVPSTAAASAALTKQQLQLQQQQSSSSSFSSMTSNNNDNNINVSTSTSSLSLQRGVSSHLNNDNTTTNNTTTTTFNNNSNNGIYNNNNNYNNNNYNSNMNDPVAASMTTPLIDIEEHNRRMKLRIKEVREIIRHFYQHLCLEEVKVLSYEACQYNILSDHKPVKALLEIKVKSVDYAQREAALVECMQTHLSAPDIYGYFSHNNNNSSSNGNDDVMINNMNTTTATHTQLPSQLQQQQQQQQSLTTTPLVLATPHYFPPSDFSITISSCPTSPVRATLGSGTGSGSGNNTLSIYGNSYSSANNINNSSFRILGSIAGGSSSGGSGGSGATRPNSSKSLGMSMSLSNSQTYPINSPIGAAAALTTSISHSFGIKIPSTLLSLQKSLILGVVCPLSLQPAALVISPSNSSYIHNIAITNVDFQYTIDFAVWESSLPVWLSVTPLTGRLTPGQTLFLNILYHGLPTGGGGVTGVTGGGGGFTGVTGITGNNETGDGFFSHYISTNSNKSITTSSKDILTTVPSRERERGYDKGDEEREKGSSVTGNLEALLVVHYAQAFSSSSANNGSSSNSGSGSVVEVEPGVVVVVDPSNTNTNLLTDFDVEPSTVTTTTTNDNHNSSNTGANTVTNTSSSKKNSNNNNCSSSNTPLTLSSNIAYSVDKLLIPLSYEATYREL